ncbi:MAG: LTA synthase family protein [Bdellovibrionales bacterium]
MDVTQQVFKIKNIHENLAVRAALPYKNPMYSRRILSKEAASFLKLISCFFLLAVFFRLVFFTVFQGANDLPYSSHELRKAFYIGFKFDLRAAILLSLPFWFLGYTLKLTNALFEEKDRQMFLSAAPHPTTLLKVIFSLILCGYSLFFMLDLGFYDYLKNRLDASSTAFLDNPLISLQMISESYPLALIFSGIAFMFVIFFVILHKLVFSEKLFVSGERVFNTPLKVTAPLFLLLAALGHGKMSQYPLRWSDAYFSSNTFISALGINPLLYFYDTFDFKEKSYDLDVVKNHYDQVSTYLKVDSPNKDTLDFTRTIKPVDAFDKEPHVVVIMMESLAAFKLQHFGQKINGAPFLNSLIPKGIFFENAYVASTGTARSIFGVITGLPDVNSIQTASRNPLLVKQYSAANAFSNYDKTYFIGGSANWGNIRGFVSQSIEDVKIFEEKDFASGKNDVWGISDLKLFREANRFLKNQPADKKQFTFIQTAGYHRPYTIPSERGEFELKSLSEKEIKDNGFVNNQEFNSLRFSDYALQEFFKLAEKEDYFKNTLFVIYADHGLSHHTSKAIPDGFKRFRLPIMHIPLLFYSPALKLPPQVVSKLAFSPDILPSTVSLAGKTFTNKTLGRNLFDEKYDDERYALTISNFSPPVKLRLHSEEWISEGTSKKLKGLYQYQKPSYEKDVSKEYVSKQKKLDRLARGLYETTKYLYHH